MYFWSYYRRPNVVVYGAIKKGAPSFQQGMKRRTLPKMGANCVDIQDIRKNTTSLGIAHLAIKHTSSSWFQQETFALVRFITLIYYL